jgi:hypothetical protein
MKAFSRAQSAPSTSMTRAPRTIVRPVLFIVLSSLCGPLYRPLYQGTGNNDATPESRENRGKQPSGLRGRPGVLPEDS